MLKVRVWNRTWNVDSWGSTPSGTYLMVLKCIFHKCRDIWLMKHNNLPVFSIFTTIIIIAHLKKLNQFGAWKMRSIMSVLLFKPLKVIFAHKLESERDWENWSYFRIIMLVPRNWVKQLKNNIHAENSNNERFYFILQMALRIAFYLCSFAMIISAILALISRKSYTCSNFLNFIILVSF